MNTNLKVPPENQMAMFKEIWKEREHFSQITTSVPIFFDHFCFAHVISKGAYPRFKLLKQNIVLMTPQQHDVYDNRTTMARGLSAFDWVFELKELFIQLYSDVPLNKKLERSIYWRKIQELYQLKLIKV